MDQEKYIALLHKQQQGTIDVMEQTLLDNWLQQAEINRVLAKKVKEEWALTAAYEPPIAFDIEEEFTALQQRIQADEGTTSKQAVAKIVPMSSSRKWLSWAAAIALVVSVGSWFLNDQLSKRFPVSTTIISSEKKEILLADGTKVWLNKKSKFTYPKTFDREQRVVQLEGEAFFDVQKNPAQPFVIETNASFITVLGTSFNVRALSNNQATEVVVKTGKVRLASQKENQSVVLLPNEKGVHQHTNNIVKKTKTADLNELAWHQKVLLFKGTPIPEVIHHLERTFNIDIQANTSALSQCTFSGRFPEPNPDQLLKAICNAFDIDLKKINDTVYKLSGGTCQ